LTLTTEQIETMAPLKVDQYEDFVLKLKIKAADGTSQIRRVRLPRIADTAGNVSYDELVGLVVTFTFPAESTPEHFDCALTYFDEDEDTVTIASTAELVDAVEQFVDKKVLRISTEVKRKSSSAASTPATTQTPLTSNGTTDRGTSTKPENLEVNLQNVLESFASVLVTAVSSLEKGLAAAPANGAYVSTASKENKSPTAEEPASKPAAAAAKPTEEPVAEHAAEPSAPAQAAASQKPAAMDNAVPYVHRRHTCDSCLMNPIVGARYHAVNMIDYDLCENCYPNYSGKETAFISYPTYEKVFRKNPPVDHVFASPPCQGFSTANEQQAPTSLPVETEPAPQVTDPPATEPAVSPESAPAQRDNELPFIHGRHTCDSCLMNPIVGKRFHSTNLKDYDLCENCHSCYEGTEIQFQEVELARDRAFQKRWNRRRQRIEKMNRKRPGRFGRGRRNECPNLTEQSEAPAPGAPTQESTARVIPIQSSEPTPSAADDFDGALKEAIRRSLEDVMPKEIQEVFEPTEPIIAPSAPTEEEVRCVDEDATATSAPEAEVVDTAAIAEEESRASSSLVEVDEQRLLDSMVEDTMSVDSEEMAGADDSKPAAVNRETSMSTPERRPTTEQCNTPGTTTDDSFALDAVGNGDIAEAMGATLDIVAGVISEMLTEADTHNSPAAILDEVIESAVEESELEVVEAAPEAEDEAVPAEEAEITTAGALIMGSEEGTEDPKEEVDGWQVVDQNPNESSDIANATQMLGSALFNSDIRSSENLESGSSVVLSTASSVPSDLPSVSVLTEESHVSEAQRNRWASQLYMMREMGFDNEEKCVETLERLQAANIGCDEDEEVSVTQAVEAMLAELK
jgi:ribosomal protein L31